MAVPAHLWLYDASGALICGGSEVMGREGEYRGSKLWSWFVCTLRWEYRQTNSNTRS